MVLEFQVLTEEKNNKPVVSVRGEIDVYSCPKLHEALSKITESGRFNIILNLENVHYIDSTGLGTIAYAAKQVNEHQGKITIVSSKPQIKKIFEISGLDKKNITLVENESDA